MKIKIKRKLEERDLSPSGFLSPEEYDDFIRKFFNPESKDYFFNKRLIFYDLETKGLLPSPYIHQFAALVYDPPQKGSIDPKKPNDYFVAKCFYSRDLFGDDDHKILARRISFYDSASKIKGKRKYPFLNLALRYAMFERKKSLSGMLIPKTGITEKYDLISAKGLCMLSYDQKYNKDLFKKINNFLLATRKKHPSVIQVKNYNFFLNYDPTKWPGKSGRDVHNIKQFAFNLWNLISTLKKEYAVKHHEKLYDYNENIKPINTIYNYISNQVFNLTYFENYSLTHYKDFPLRQFADGSLKQDEKDAKKQIQKQFKHIKNPKDINLKNTIIPKDSSENSYDVGLVSEKHALEGFLSFISKNNKNRDSVLVGQNIKRFDNAVILNRAEFHRINKGPEFESFYDSLMYDTLPFFKNMIKLLLWYEQSFKDIYISLGADENQIVSHFAPENHYQPLSTITTGPSQAIYYDYNQSPGKPKLQETKDQDELVLVKKQATLLINKLRQKYPSPKAKLDGLMHMFKNPNDVNFKEQTHTADDDCVQLANVFLKAWDEMQTFTSFYYKIYDKLKNLQVKYKTIEVGLENKIKLKNRKKAAFVKSKLQLHKDFTFEKMINYISKKMAEDVMFRKKVEVSDFRPTEFLLGGAANLNKVIGKYVNKTNLDWDYFRRMYQLEKKEKAKQYTRLVCQEILRQAYKTMGNNIISILFLKSNELIEKYWDKEQEKALKSINSNPKLKGALGQTTSWSFESTIRQGKRLQDYFKDEEDAESSTTVESKNLKENRYERTKRFTIGRREHQWEL